MKHFFKQTKKQTTPPPRLLLQHYPANSQCFCFNHEIAKNHSEITRASIWKVLSTLEPGEGTTMQSKGPLRFSPCEETPASQVTVANPEQQ